MSKSATGCRIKCFIPIENINVEKLRVAKFNPNEFSQVCLKWIQKSASLRLEDAFSVTISHLSRRLGERKVVTLKTSSRRLGDMPWRRLEDIPWRCLEDVLETKNCSLGIYVSHKSKCVFRKSIFHKSMSDASKANALIRTQ